MRIALVTPLFPISSEPYRGQPIYKTVRALTAMAELEAFYVSTWYPPLLHPRGWQYKPADPTWQPEGVRTHYFTYPSIPLLGRLTNAAAASRAMLAPLRRFRPDVILSYWLFPEGLAATRAGRKLGIPVIVGSRGSDLLRIADPITRKGTMEAVRTAAATLVVSEELRRKAVSFGAPPDRVHNIVNGCDRAIFHPADKAQARQALGLSADAAIVLYIGHLVEAKGVLELVEACRALRPSMPNLQLALIGEGALHASLAAGDTGGLTLVGPKSAREIAQWMAACDVFSLPSHSEGCPNVVLEALACGRPVVGTTVGAIPDLLDESSGLLTPVRDAPALRQTLERALRMSWDEAAIAALHGRSWDDVARDTLQVCAGVIDAVR